MATSMMQNTSFPQQGGGTDWNQILSGLGGLAGAYGSYQSGKNQQQGVGNLLKQPGINQMPFTGPGGTANAGAGGINSQLGQGLAGNFSGANQFVGNQLGNMGGATRGLLNSTQTSNNQLGSLFGGIQGQLGQTGQLMNQAQGVFGNGMTSAADQAAMSNMQQGGQNFNNVYQGSLSNIMGALRPQQDQQAAAMQDQQFGRGQMGSSGGALQTRAMYQGFGQADLAAQQQAYNQALSQQQQNVNAATAYSGIGNQNLALGGNLMNSAFSNFNQLTGMGGQLANSQFGNNNTNAMTQGALAGYGQQIGSNINQIGMGNAQLAAQVGLGSAGNQINALHGGGQLAQTQTNQTGNVVGGLLNGLTAGGTNSPLNSLLGMFRGQGGSGQQQQQSGYDPFAGLGDLQQTPGLDQTMGDLAGLGSPFTDANFGSNDFMSGNFDPFGNPQ